MQLLCWWHQQRANTVYLKQIQSWMWILSLNRLTFSKWCATYILVNYNYVDIVKPNVLHFNRDFLFSFFFYQLNSCCIMVLSYRRILEGWFFSLVIRSRPFVGIYFVNKGTNITSSEMVPAKKTFCQKSLHHIHS